MAVAHDQPVTALVPLTGQLSYVGVDFRLQSDGQHPPRALADDLVDQGAVWRGTVSIDYREHGRAFPTGAANAGLLGDLQSITREGTPLACHPSPDPQVLSIARHSLRGLLGSLVEEFPLSLRGF